MSVRWEGGFLGFDFHSFDSTDGVRRKKSEHQT